MTSLGRGRLAGCARPLLCPAAMDLLEYQGKQLLARHAIPVPAGEPARTVEEALMLVDRAAVTQRDNCLPA